MDKKIYVAPEAELIMFVPAEDIAASWHWDVGTFGQNASVVTGNIPIFEDKNDSWKYDGAEKPY